MRAIDIHTHFILSFTFFPPTPARACVRMRATGGVKGERRERSPQRAGREDLDA